MRPGGYRAEAAATNEVREMIDSLHSNIASSLGRSAEDLGRLNVHVFTSRAVLGGNFIVKVSTMTGEVFHVRANRLPSGSVLLSVDKGYSLESPLT